MQRPETFSGRIASQRTEELDGFIGELTRSGARSYLEIGARHGDTFHSVMSSLPVGSVGVAVDLPGGAWGVDSSRSALNRAVDDLKAKGYRVAAVYGDSTSDIVTKEVLGLMAAFGVVGFDAALIDGDHRYEGVKSDWEIWGPLARVVAFHDIAGEGVFQRTQGYSVEVPRLWSELKATLPASVAKVEYVGEGEPLMGIGVLIKPER